LSEIFTDGFAVVRPLTFKPSSAAKRATERMELLSPVQWREVEMITVVISMGKR
jgi:hypothetical protein